MVSSHNDADDCAALIDMIDSQRTEEKYQEIQSQNQRRDLMVK